MMSGRLLRIPFAKLLVGALFAVPAAARATNDLARQLTEAVVCGDPRARVFDHYIAAYADGQVSSEALNGLDPALEAVHKLLTFEVGNFSVASRDADEKDPVLHLIRLEMRSRLEPEYERLNDELDRALADAKRFGEAQGFVCAESAGEELLRGRTHRREPHAGDFAFAARRTMATSYQSCKVLDLAPVDDRVGNVDGVRRAIAIDEVGWGRAYSDLRLLKRTHYYHRVTQFSGNCLNQDRKPLVYDYGGEPAIDRAEGSLNLFANVGGGPALGIDCSAFVSTSVVSAGGLYREGTRNRAEYTRFTSRDFINAEASRWSCFEQVRVDQDSTIEPGDIAAVRGHVVMIDSIGDDPFGLTRVTASSQCSRLSPRNFDFVVIQSSPSKEHLGINRYVARDYLSEEGKMQDLFMRHAYQACLSKFDRRQRIPSTEQYGIIRHRRSENCLAPRVQLKHEDCVATCAGL